MLDLNTIDFEKIIAIIKDTAQLFGSEAAASHIKAKGPVDFVTEVDTTVQRVIHDQLAALYPQIQFMGEEKDNSDIDFDKPVWILDPVDGTTNLIHHFQASCVSLGLADNHQLTAGIIYNPYADELFFARKGGGGYRNGKPIHVSSAPDLAASLISVGTAPYYREYTDKTFSQIREIYLRSQDIRRIGSAAIDLSYVACGRTEAFFEQSLKPWDFAAGTVILEEAGGRVTDYSGNPLSIEKPQNVLATNSLIHDEMLEILNH